MTPPPHASSSAPAPDVPEPGAARGSGQAHAKAILLGEHAAVYGSPAIAVPVGSLTVTALAVPATGASGSRATCTRAASRRRRPGSPR